TCALPISSSLDTAWHDFFADCKPTQSHSQQSAQSWQPKQDNAAASGPNGTGDGAAATPSQPTQPQQPQGNQQPRTSEQQHSSAVTPQPAPGKPAAANQAANQTAAAGHGTQSTAAQQSAPAAGQPEQTEETGPEAKRLRGPAAAIAKNMHASLSLPTATSVRAVPAKLMADNRIVINNHLKRGRGGKISFTHLIGYAMVRALHEFPNMNRHYTEVDGKPHAVTPEHVNLGLAIDQQGKDGSRNLVVAAIMAVED